MTIAWRPTMAIGDEVIDTDHKQLIDLINSVELTLQAAGGKAELGKTLDELGSYTHDHFQREEHLMSSMRYHGLVQHRLAHRELRLKLVTLRADLEAAKADAVPAGEVERLVSLLRSWLLDHVLKEDMLLKAFLKSSS